MDNWRGKNMNEKISVIIITRNREKMLEGCLESLVKQTRLPDEVVVVDNASEDKTKKIILSFKEKLPVRYFQEKKIGIPYARNRGIKEASGSLILMLDDDCKADKFWAERTQKAHQKYPNAWAIQGRTFSVPKTRLFCLIAEFKRFLSVRRYAKSKLPLRKMGNFFRKDFRDETEFLTCDTRNFSIKTSYFKKHKLSFDEDFYRGSDSDLGRQIMQKNGIIMFCPNIQAAHSERSSLKEFLTQRWHIGRTAARIANKWKTPNLTINAKFMLSPNIFLSFFLFCNVFSQWRKLPMLIALLFLDRLYYFNGWYYEIQKHNNILAEEVSQNQHPGPHIEKHKRDKNNKPQSP